MRSIPLLCAVVVSATLAFSQTPAPKAPSLFEQELGDNEKQFMQALQEKNVAYINQVISDDFRGIASNGDFYEKDELVGSTRQGMPRDFRIYDVRVVRLDDNCAVVAYNQIVPGAHPRYRHVSDTWTKDDGKWRLKFQQATPNLCSAIDLD